jgi:hypothetical protein
MMMAMVAVEYDYHGNKWASPLSLVGVLILKLNLSIVENCEEYI